MPRRRALIATTAAALFLTGLGATTAHADGSVTDLYVSSGSACTDSGTGTMTAPYCTLQAAADAVVAGHTVHIGAASPVFPVVLSKSGTANAPITFTGWTSWGTVSLAAMNASDPRAGQPMITFRNAQYVNLRNLNLHPGANTSISLVNAQHIGIDQVVQQGSVTSLPSSSAGPDGAITIDGASSYVSILHSITEYTAGDGISIGSGAQHIVLASDGIEAPGAGVRADGVQDLELAGDTTLASGGGVVITGSTSGSVENTVMMPKRLDQSGPPAINVSADSTGGVTEDYNSVTADKSHLDYDWGGTTYASSAAMHTATGQGRHDVDTLPGPSVIPTEGSPLIDSGDAGAPGESATDLHGKARVDDPTVPNTGTGSGYVDRGALEFTDPFSLGPITASVATGPAPLLETLTAPVHNSWGTGVTSYSIDFGDGTAPTTSATPTAEHTYATVGTYNPHVTATLSDGTKRSYPSASSVIVRTAGPLVATPSVGSDGLNAGFSISTTGSWPMSSGQVSFGDGSPAVPFDLADPSSRHTYSAPGTYTVSGSVSDTGGRTVSFSKALAVGTRFVPVTAARILDTRTGTGAAKHKVGPGGVLRLKVTGSYGVPSDGSATAVTMNLTDADATSSSWVEAYPEGTARPANSSNLNFKAGETNPNLVTVPVGADGYVDLYNASGSVDLIADLRGYYTTAGSAAGIGDTYIALAAPQRILDTRSCCLNPQPYPFGSGQSRTLIGSLGSFRVPLYATAVVMNVTSTNASADGWVAAMPAGSPPTVSDLNYSRGKTGSNLVVSRLDQYAGFTLYNSNGHTDLIADVAGFFIGPGGFASGSGGRPDPSSTYVPLAPSRIADTRVGSHHLGSGATLRIKVVGTQGIPVGVAAVTINLTGTGSTEATYLTAFAGGARPRASNLNLVPGRTRPVQAIVPVDGSGYISVYNYTGTVDAIVDLEGYYGPTS
ncbi:PKD domain-containing protein [Streptacidiphilus sp. EB103A]|uniref:PKD domain-containing protein n=1 Tax=Streptacidiphilus sp. EB103A TaxID=3156275 RepID=UPI00351849E1